ncbi:GL15596 [Drosophila persimilis]|uniref:GL15596 n=1 Tax=Drosophila persimilis TaxID=7234 RepID=B4H6Q6_DROPE|nr:GL15596 [Drosophila persimilis]
MYRIVLFMLPIVANRVWNSTKLVMVRGEPPQMAENLLMSRLTVPGERKDGN